MTRMEENSREGSTYLQRLVSAPSTQPSWNLTTEPGSRSKLIQDFLCPVGDALGLYTPRVQARAISAPVLDPVLSFKRFRME
ncbi:uncharacterized protein LOC132383230 isoform X4 [Hypanus sabinus]|uniref:uncharacterized protein LOC132383230 isoform X4 n=1 Tax=Hypanus sabinus TaxID=79690 RepID=UPI0028C377B5|nr:uncharacterized protein LOC132383230 isoform X4 [Hypanus sabinus]